MYLHKTFDYKTTGTRITSTGKAGLPLIFVAVAVMLSGCMQGGGGSSGAEPSTAENYVYKGRKDPLMEASADERAEIMAKRFNLIQARQ